MVKPGGISGMLGQWRVVIKQAEESARVGRLDEALTLLARSDVAEHRQAVQLRGRLVRDLVQRARRRCAADDCAGAMEDLDVAERHGAAPDLLAEARLALAERLALEIQPILEAGDPGRAIDRIDALAKRHVSGPVLRRCRESAEAWKEGLDEARRGEFGRSREALDRASRLLSGPAGEALAASRRELDSKQETAQPRIERLYRALGAGCDWGEILSAAESVIEAIPEHSAARQARSRSWQHIGALNPSAALPTRPTRGVRLPGLGLDLQPDTNHPIRYIDSKDDAPTSSDPPIVFLDETPPGRAAARTEAMPEGRFLLWADTVGGYLVCLDSQVVIGRAGHDSTSDIPILGDLSRRHVSLVRQGDGYVVKAHQPAYINGRPVVGTAPLRDRDVLRLGPSVEILFRQPSAVSATARLEIVSRHRLPLAVEGVILMAETCIIGPPGQGHVPAPQLQSQVVLFKQGGNVCCRAPGTFEVDGSPQQGRAALGPRSRVRGDGFSFSVEPLAAKAATG